MPAAQLYPVLRHLHESLAPDVSDGELLVRFASSGDDSAFAALVRRHGSLVLAVCRRRLQDEHAAEDAFQATFLVLARRAAGIARPELLGNWLHGVACRIAARAWRDLRRRRIREGHFPPPGTVGRDEGVEWREVREVLDEELERLPDRYRIPLVLCYLQGLTNAEAARRLGCSRGTLAARLARGRNRLRAHLLRRGLTLSTSLAALAYTQPATAALAPNLVAATVGLAQAFLVGDPLLAGAGTAQAISWAKGVTHSMLVEKMKALAVVLVSSLTLAGIGSALLAQPTTGGPVPVREEPPPPLVAEEERNDEPYRTANFEVTAPTRKVAMQVAERAEKCRKELAQSWLGKEMPAWPKRCPVKVRILRGGMGGATVFHYAKGKAQIQQMQLEGPLESILADALPHEVTHTILAHHFGRPVPRWADEGASILAESEASQANHLRSMRRGLTEGTPIPLRRLLPMREYPREVTQFYSQGTSLTEFLVNKGGRAHFLRYLDQADRESWDRATRDQYGYDTVEELEQAWKQHVEQAKELPPDPKPIQEAPPVFPRWAEALPAKPILVDQLPLGPGPSQGVAEVKGDRLLIWRAAPSRERIFEVQPDGKVVSRDRERTQPEAWYYPEKDVRVLDMTGKTLPRSVWSKRLQERTLVLLGDAEKPVDPGHLSVFRKDLLLVLVRKPVPVLSPPGVLPATSSR